MFYYMYLSTSKSQSVTKKSTFVLTESNSTLEILDLSWNQISRPGAQALAAGLRVLFKSRISRGFFNSWLLSARVHYYISKIFAMSTCISKKLSYIQHQQWLFKLFSILKIDSAISKSKVIFRRKKNQQTNKMVSFIRNNI